jgi:hypothetical protein
MPIGTGLLASGVLSHDPYALHPHLCELLADVVRLCDLGVVPIGECGLLGRVFSDQQLAGYEECLLLQVLVVLPVVVGADERCVEGMLK